MWKTTPKKQLIAKKKKKTGYAAEKLRPIFETTVFAGWGADASGVIDGGVSSVYSVFLLHCYDDEWDDYELEHTESASTTWLSSPYPQHTPFFHSNYLFFFRYVGFRFIL